MVFVHPESIEKSYKRGVVCRVIMKFMWIIIILQQVNYMADKRTTTVCSDRVEKVLLHPLEQFTHLIDRFEVNLFRQRN